MSSRLPSPISPELLSAYLDGALSTRERQLVEEAIQRDPEIAWQVESLRRTVVLVRELPEIALPRSFAIPVSQVQDVVDRRQKQRAPGWLDWLQRLVVILQGGNPILRNMAAVAAVLFVVLIGRDLYTPNLFQANSTPAMVQELATTSAGAAGAEQNGQTAPSSAPLSAQKLAQTEVSQPDGSDLPAAESAAAELAAPAPQAGTLGDIQEKRPENLSAEAPAPMGASAQELVMPAAESRPSLQSRSLPGAVGGGMTGAPAMPSPLGESGMGGGEVESPSRAIPPAVPLAAQAEQAAPMEVAAAEQAVAEQAVAEQAVAEQAVAEQAVAEQAAAEQAVAEQAAAEQAAATDGPADGAQTSTLPGNSVESTGAPAPASLQSAADQEMSSQEQETVAEMAAEEPSGGNMAAEPISNGADTPATTVEQPTPAAITALAPADRGLDKPMETLPWLRLTEISLGLLALIFFVLWRRSIRL